MGGVNEPIMRPGWLDDEQMACQQPVAHWPIYGTDAG